MGIFSFLFGGGSRDTDFQSREMSGATLHIDGAGTYDFDIVGEASYQENLEQIAGPKTEAGHEHECMAVLIPEPDNRYDRNAVRVDINSLTVGYIPKEIAAAIAGMIARSPAVSRFSVDAIIVGGWRRRNGSEGSFGVKLDMPEE